MQDAYRRPGVISQRVFSFVVVRAEEDEANPYWWRIAADWCWNGRTLRSRLDGSERTGTDYRDGPSFVLYTLDFIYLYAAYQLGWVGLCFSDLTLVISWGPVVSLWDYCLTRLLCGSGDGTMTYSQLMFTWVPPGSDPIFMWACGSSCLSPFFRRPCQSDRQQLFWECVSSVHVFAHHGI